MAKLSQTRYFNRIEYSGDTVKKMIFDQARGKDEVYFYKTLPLEEKIFFPDLKRILSHKTAVIYEMEYIPYQDISQIYLQQELSPRKFRTLLRAIDVYWMRAQVQAVSSRKWIATANKVIVERMNRRWSDYQKLPVYRKMLRSFKSKYDLDLNQMKQALGIALENGLSNNLQTKLFRTHGDLCFSNMFLLTNNKVKFVDPRGGRKKQDLFIPLLYDLAKLSQCVYGNYDGINAKRKIPFASQQMIFEKWLQTKKIDTGILRLVESSHFLSLLPLHADKPQKHEAFLLAAVGAYRSALCHL